MGLCECVERRCVWVLVGGWCRCELVLVGRWYVCGCWWEGGMCLWVLPRCGCRKVVCVGQCGCVLGVVVKVVQVWVLM